MSLIVALAAAAAAAGAVEEFDYGTTADGRKVQEFVLRNARGSEARIITYGAIVTSLSVPDRRGRRSNVVLGFANLRDYEARNQDYRFGAIMGRYTGRIANARFTLDGRDVRLVANDGTNALHGGPGGLDTKVWTAVPWTGDRNPGVVLDYTSPAGEQGFPGTLRIRVTYRLMADNALRIDYAATTNASTHVNFTNHSYFNLAGAGSGTVLNHLLQIPSPQTVEADQRGIPTGRFPTVQGTDLDFRSARPLKDCLRISDRGCNHSWTLPFDGKLNRAARLMDPGTGRIMDVLTTEPSIHLYTAGYMSGQDLGAQGTPYRAFDGVALEAQHLQDTPNKPEFPSTLLRPGETYRATTIYRFSTL